MNSRYPWKLKNRPAAKPLPFFTCKPHGRNARGIIAPFEAASDPGIKSVPTPATVGSATRRDERELRDAYFAMRLSLFVGLAMLIGKTTVYFMTHSAAIFSDAAESVVHVIAVGFASLVSGSAQDQLPSVPPRLRADLATAELDHHNEPFLFGLCRS